MSLGGYSLLAAGDEEAVLLRKDLVKHVGQMSQYKQLRGTPWSVTIFTSLRWSLNLSNKNTYHYNPVTLVGFVQTHTHGRAHLSTAVDTVVGETTCLLDHIRSLPVSAGWPAGFLLFAGTWEDSEYSQRVSLAFFSGRKVAAEYYGYDILCFEELSTGYQQIYELSISFYGLPMSS